MTEGVISWRGPRGWSRWHLVTDGALLTACDLDIPAFAPLFRFGRDDVGEVHLCLQCRAAEVRALAGPELPLELSPDPLPHAIPWPEWLAWLLLRRRKRIA